MGLLRRETADLLLRADFGKIVELSLNNKRVFRRLISLSYDKEDILSWRAIEAIGRAVGSLAGRDPVAARNIVHRLLWSVSDESGGIGWSAPEMLAEIVIHSNGVYNDLPPIILSFHEEEPFLKGVLWAMGRLADTGAAYVDGASELTMKSLGHSDPAVRGLALWAATKLKVHDIRERARGMLNDKERFKFYEGRELLDMTVGDMAEICTGHTKS
ncbi:MAG: DVU0298 family protein [Nitrospirota bacterium]